MTVPREELLARARQWAAHAEDDMRVAQHTLTLRPRCPYRLVAYHAQQCAEKYLKAYLVLCGVDFPYTHNIARLLELCSERADWESNLTEAEKLTPFAITARYPGSDEPVSEAEARQAVDIAGRVRDEIRTALGADGLAF